MLTITEYEVRLGRGLSGLARSQAEAFLGDAADLVRLVVDDAFDVTVPASVKTVIYKMVRRAVTNPLDSEEESIGDYARGDMGNVYMTGKEIGIVRKAAGLPWLVEINLSTPLPLDLLNFRDNDLFGAEGLR